MQRMRLCKNLRSKEVSDEKGKGMLWTMECHIKIGHRELSVISRGACDCDPALGAAGIHSQYFNYGDCLSKYTQAATNRNQLETAAFSQLITRSSGCLPMQKHTRHSLFTPPPHCLHTQETGSQSPVEFCGTVFIPSVRS